MSQRWGLVGLGITQWRSIFCVCHLCSSSTSWSRTRLSFMATACMHTYVLKPELTQGLQWQGLVAQNTGSTGSIQHASSIDYKLCSYKYYLSIQLWYINEKYQADQAVQPELVLCPLVLISFKSFRCPCLIGSQSWNRLQARFYCTDPTYLSLQPLHPQWCNKLCLWFLLQRLHKHRCLLAAHTKEIWTSFLTPC